MHYNFRHDDAHSLARDFGLIAEAVADTIRGLIVPAHMDSRASKATNCGCGK